jgi:hypothetical protein
MLEEQEFLQRQYSSLIGKKIKAIRLLTDSEVEDLYWDKTYGDVAFAIILDDDQVLIPSSDPECNGPGFILLGDLVTS